MTRGTMSRYRMYSCTSFRPCELPHPARCLQRLLGVGLLVPTTPDSTREVVSHDHAFFHNIGSTRRREQRECSLHRRAFRVTHSEFGESTREDVPLRVWSLSAPKPWAGVFTYQQRLVGFDATLSAPFVVGSISTKCVALGSYFVLSIR